LSVIDRVIVDARRRERLGWPDHVERGHAVEDDQSNPSRVAKMSVPRVVRQDVEPTIPDIVLNASRLRSDSH